MNPHVRTLITEEIERLTASRERMLDALEASVIEYERLENLVDETRGILAQLKEALA